MRGSLQSLRSPTEGALRCRLWCLCDRELCGRNGLNATPRVYHVTPTSSHLYGVSQPNTTTIHFHFDLYLSVEILISSHSSPHRNSDVFPMPYNPHHHLTSPSSLLFPCQNPFQSSFLQPRLFQGRYSHGLYHLIISPQVPSFHLMDSSTPRKPPRKLACLRDRISQPCPNGIFLVQPDHSFVFLCEKTLVQPTS